MSTISTNYRRKSVKIKTAKHRDASSNQWLQRQLNDPYVARAKLDGYRSRAAYKLIEINQKFNILMPGIRVVDLGAAPGGWSQVAAKIIQSGRPAADNSYSGRVIACDLLDIEEIPGVIFIKKDFFDEDAAEIITTAINGKADLVLSDMAANTTGHNATDHLRIMALCELALDFALTILKPGGHFVAKIFRGGAEAALLNKVKLNFRVVKHFKPPASRKGSTEFYLVALSKKAGK